VSAPDRHSSSVRLAEDTVPGTRVAVALAALVLLVAGGSIWVSVALARREALLYPDAGRGPNAAPLVAGPVRVLVTPIASDGSGLRAARRAREALGTYAWVDRDEGVVHIPIERAMEIVGGEPAWEPEK
jgi:hypothetical protein